MLNAIARAALDLLLPPGCACCDAPVAAPGQLCGPCFQQMRFIGEPMCRRCGQAFASHEQGGVDQLCAGCTEFPPNWGRARAALFYDGAAKQLILPLKHADRQENAETLALHMHRAGLALLKGAEWLVPVPLHRTRLLRRRYNQAALLAAALARRTSVPCLPDALMRIKPTAPLGGRSAAQRAALLAGSIAVRPRRQAALAGRRIVLIDDVLTSGATARACAQALLDAGAANIDVLAASRVADPRGDGGSDMAEDEDENEAC